MKWEWCRRSLERLVGELPLLYEENQLEVICHELVCLGVNVVQLVGEALDDLHGLVSNPSNSGYEAVVTEKCTGRKGGSKGALPPCSPHNLWFQ